MFLHLKKGNEYRLYRSHDISNEDDFMYPTYRQALDALYNVVKTAKAFRNSQVDREYPLYGYANNIIAFSGDRGQGKTSTMLSFSGIISSGFKSCEERDERFNNCVFSVLPPIDPTILEKNQSFLALVLSRMYSYAQREWEKALKCEWRGSNQISECNKNELLTLFQKCLSGINATRQKSEERFVQNLSDIEEMSDGAILKNNLYRLTDRLLEFCNASHDANMFLVIQLDDTDVQVNKGYEILEDIRRYLSIPNVIILMATDTEMLRRVITQHFLDEFVTSLRHNDTGVGQFTQMGRKYLDKLIPPIHVIYLPHMDEMILRQDKYLSLEYMEESEESGKSRDLLQPPGYVGESAGKDFSFQSLVLRYIYRKTGLVFVESREHLHRFIPTTLRGLNQLLGLLSTLEDIPVVTKEDLQDEERFRKALRKKADISEQNLQVFENYFINDWVNGKLTEDKLKAFTELYETPTAHRIPFAIGKLQEIYGEAPLSSKKEYVDLMAIINTLKQKHRMAMDLYFFMAVLTLLAIQFHKSIAYQERLASEREKGEGPLLISCPKAEYFPKKLYVPTNLDEDLKGIFFPIIAEVYRDELKTIKDGAQISTYLLTKDLKDYRFNPIDYIAFFLHLDDAGFKDLVSGECPQEAVYVAQQAAITIAANPEVQASAIAELHEKVKEFTDSKHDMPKRTMNCLNSAFRKINQSFSGDMPMIESDLAQLIDKFAQSDKYTPSLYKWYDIALIKSVEDGERREALLNIIRWADGVRGFLERTPKQSSMIKETTIRLLDDYKEYVVPSNPHGFDTEKMLAGARKDTLPSGTTFWNRFNDELDSVCTYYGIPSKDILNQFNKKK